MRLKFLLAAFFLIAFGYYLHNAAPTVTTGDSGEFITAAETLSLPHAPSFPLYMMSGKLFATLLPWGNPGYKTNVYSASTAAATVTLLALVVLIWLAPSARLGESVPWRIFTGKPPWSPVFGGLAVAAVFGLTRSFWMNALVTEVFPLNTFFAVILLLILVDLNADFFRRSVLFFFVLGLGVGNHQTLVFLAPSWLWIAWPRRGAWLAARPLAQLTAAALLGFSIYFVLPIRSAAEPPLNWGHPTTAQRFYRTIARKDYGSLSLATGETPERSFANTGRQLGRFLEQMRREAPWPILLVGLIGLGWGWTKRDLFAQSVFLLFLISGPGFYLFSNLPMTNQSFGIMGRFAILPMMSLAVGMSYFTASGLPARWGGVSPGLSVIFAVFLFLTNAQEAHAHRQTRMVWDYGNAMLRTLPPKSMFFLDGGDDAFYSLAMLHYILGKRPDVRIHDRGGLIYKNIYGPDFRTLTKLEKKRRRAEIESAFLKDRPVYYSTMDPKALPGTNLHEEGLLMRATVPSGADMSWALIAVRSLYPLRPADYRSRALGAFFPFMKGRQSNDWRTLERAKAMGRDVDWLKINLGFYYAKLGYDAIQRGRLDRAAAIYQAWMDLDPAHFQPVGNLGVIREKQGREEEARALYEKSIALSDKAVDPVYNLAVWYWKRKDWPQVIAYLEETLRRAPNHKAARAYLEKARAYQRNHE